MKEIKERKSIRKYQSGLVSEDDLNRILEAGRLSPSAKNKQPWEFVVIRNQDVKKGIADELTAFLGKVNPTSTAIFESSLIINVFNCLENDNLNILSIGACIENMLLEATHLGYGSLWIGYTLNISDYIARVCDNKGTLLATICLGIKGEEAPARPRKELSEFVKFID